MNRAMIAAGAAATLALVAMPAAAVGATAAPTQAQAKAQNTSDAKVAPNKWGSYIVVMKGDPLTATIAQKDLGSADALRRKAALIATHDAVVERAGLASGKKVQDYTTVLNGFSVLASQSQAQKLAADPAVLRVMSDELRQKTSLPMAAGDDEIAAEPGETLQEFLGTDGTSTKGDGQLLGVIDSGIWPEHPSFADDGTYRPGKLNSKGGTDKCDFGNTKANPDDAKWSCNKKLVGARQMLATYRAVVGVLPGEFDSARDDDGHGTHTASTAAGNANVRAWTYDETRTLDTTSGVAPRAQIVAYKALGSLGGFSSDLAAAIDQAVFDGVDVINYSIGGGPGLTSADAISFLFANRAGVHVATSAGNDGPNPSTIGGPADLPWVTTVGASTQPRFYAGTVVLGDGTEVLGSSVTLGSAQDLPLVDAKSLGNEFCLSKSQLDDDAAYATFAAAADGSMVLCWRGAIGRSEKSLNVMNAGGEAMILTNQSDVDNYFTDNFRVPTVMVDRSEGDVIAAYAAEPGDATATITDTGAISTFEPAPSMALFSSRGPNPSASSIIKPDITAPGVQVLAGASPMSADAAFEPGQLFQAIAGTSMSSPVMAGVYLLIDQLHPTWTPAMVKSAAMSTAYQGVLDNDRTTDADPFDFGAGHVDAVSAFNPGLVYNAGFSEFLGFYCGSDARNDVFANADATCAGLEAAGVPTTVENLNYPTIGVGALAGVASVERKVTNVLGSSATFTATVQNPPGLEVEVSPASLTLAAGATGSFTVTITNVGAEVNDEWQFGSLTWTGGGASARSNIAVYPTAVSAPGIVTGSGATSSVDLVVTTGYEGTYTPVAGGLTANDPLTGSVSQDPDQTFDGCTDGNPGTTAAPISVADDTAYLRLSYLLATDDDIDLFLCKGADVVAQSTAGGTNELIELSHPEPGAYTLYVHGWQVVTSPLEFSIDRWQVVRGNGTPLLTVSPTSAAATIGGTVDVTASWDGAPTGTSFGVVDHTMTGGASLGLTVVQVDNQVG